MQHMAGYQLPRMQRIRLRWEDLIGSGRKSYRERLLRQAWVEGDAHKVATLIFGASRLVLWRLNRFIVADQMSASGSPQVVYAGVHSLLVREGDDATLGFPVLTAWTIARCEWDADRLLAACQAVIDSGIMEPESARNRFAENLNSDARIFAGYTVKEARQAARWTRINYDSDAALSEMADAAWGVGAGAVIRQAGRGPDHSRMKLGEIGARTQQARHALALVAATWDGTEATLDAAVATVAALPSAGAAVAAQLAMGDSGLSTAELLQLATVLGEDRE